MSIARTTWVKSALRVVEVENVRKEHCVRKMRVNALADMSKMGTNSMSEHLESQ